MRAEAWGIARAYRDTAGRRRSAPRATVAAILRAMDAGGEAPAPAAVRIARVGEPVAVDGPAEVLTEDGARIPVRTMLPRDLPTGYHRLRRLADGTETPLILSPGTCQSPEEPQWGWAVQLYATRSQNSWGMGDLGGLAELGRWAAGLGAGVLLLNPLHAPAPTRPQEPSPYFPSSRLFLNPLYLAVEEVPGADLADPQLAAAAAAGKELNRARLIDRDRIFEIKMAALERIWTRFEGSPDFDSHRRGRPGLEDYATYCAIAQEQGPAWRRWPAALRHPSSAGVKEFRRAHADRIAFHAWLQWLLEAQMARAASTIALVQDLAVGFTADGADAWIWQDLLDFDMEVGAPPDDFNTKGQNWGLPPFDPWKLRAAGYQPFIETIRAGLRHGRGLRIDHVMGLFRLFWIPRGAGPETGAYVRYPAGDLLDLLALESRRARALVVGEDLGTVDDSVRSELAARSVLSYRVFWFERRPPARYPSRALAAVTTHDLPTVAGVVSGDDLRIQEELGLNPNRTGMEQMRRRLETAAGLGPGASLEELTVAVHRALSGSPCQLVTATLEDALGVTERPNLPGTGQRPNWSLALPKKVEEIERDPGVLRLAAALARPGS